MLRARSLHGLLWRIGTTALLGLVTIVAGAQAQASWKVDPQFSLAWWQVSPHLNHLWATSCPEEPSWRPGEGRSSGWSINPELRTASKQGYRAVADTINVPLYPRTKVEAVCTEAVQGMVVVPDTARLRGVHGKVVVRADALISGSNERDHYARGAILQTARYKTVTYTLDSVVNVTRQGDTVHAIGVGTFTLREVTQPMRAVLVAWPEAGALRVMGKVRIRAADMVPVYGMSRFALGLGIGTKIWQDLFAGVDMVLRPEGAPAGN